MLASTLRTAIPLALSLVCLASSANCQVVHEAYIKASNPDSSDNFGSTVSMSGDTLVIGAPHEQSAAAGIDGDQSDNSLSSAGAAYVFTLSGSTWVQQAYLKASNPRASSTFGNSVAISGDTLVVGARNEPSNATGVNGDQNDTSSPNSGAAYVFVRSGSTWTQQAYLKASNTDIGDRFGTSVALDGETLIVGARREGSNSQGVDGLQTDNSAGLSGAAYVFTRTGTIWSQQAYLKASNTSANDEFGSAVAIDSDTVVVGAQFEDSDAQGIDGDGFNSNLNASGAAYVFTRSGTTWSQQAYVKASNTGSNDRFGSSVTVSGETIVVGAAQEKSAFAGVNANQNDDSAGQAGAAYVFVRSGSAWTQQAFLKASTVAGGDQFGWATSLAGETLLVSAHLEKSDATCIDGNEISTAASLSGAAYLFDRVGSTWTQRSYIKASNTGGSDQFGHSLTLSGDLAVVGAYFERSMASGVNGDQSDNSLFGSGAAYLINLNATVPVLSPVGADLCSGDGGNQAGCTNCPCTNNAVAGTVGGCLNSAGTSARLFAAGDTSATAPLCGWGDLRFSLTGAPPSAFCILNSGDAAAPTNPANACFGMDSGTQAMQFDGLRCAVMNTRRHGGRSADLNGDVGLTGSPWGGEGGPQKGIAQAGAGFVSGQTRYFQVINRDDALLSCMRGLNTSQAIRIMFTP